LNSPLKTVAFTVPPLIRKNTALIALSQSFTGAGMQLAYGLGPLMVYQLTGSAGLSGLSVALIGLSRFAVSYPIGKITDAYGRLPGIFFGLALALVGALTVGCSLIAGSIAVFVGGMLIFGMGMNASQQMRVAATDMYPPQMRARALGYVAMGSLLGLCLMPIMMTLSDRYAAGMGVDPLALPWFMVPVLIIGGMAIVRTVRPDPKHIGLNLKHYYPDYEAPKQQGSHAGAFSAWAWLKKTRTLLAIVCNCAGQGNMSIVMVLTSLVLSHHGYTLTQISYSHAFHSAGLFAFTITLGKMADRFGRGSIMYPGVGISVIGAGLVAFTPTYAMVTLGTFLVGLGWAGANVASTALLADETSTAERGRAIGLNDSFGGSMTVLTAVITGPLIEFYGLPSAGLTAVALACIPFFLLAGTMLRNGGRMP
jgi:MFS family permease